jgi:hypothetical protein
MSEQPQSTPSSSPENNSSHNNNNNNNNKDKDVESRESSEDELSSPKVEDLNKPTGIKSSYYHFKSTPAEEAAKYAPKPIDPATVAQPKSANSGSTWNAAGTWEEKDLSSWAQDTLKKLLLSVVIPSHSDMKINITSVNKCTGDASIVYSRGKKRIGYDMHASIEWSGEYKAAPCKGHINVDGVEETNDEDDYVIKVTYSTSEESDSSAAEKCATLVKKAIPDVRKQIAKFVEEIKRHP